MDTSDRFALALLISTGIVFAIALIIGYIVLWVSDPVAANIFTAACVAFTGLLIGVFVALRPDGYS